MNALNPSRCARCTIAAALAMMCASVLASGAARASGPYVRFGVVVGPPYWGYYPYAPPYYYPYAYPYYAPQYYPPVVVAPSSPPVYVEKGQPSSARPAPVAPQAPVWYYCPTENGYYPYVRKCPSGWETLPAQPPPSPPVAVPPPPPAAH
jgi:hypothetical protein